MQKIQLFVYIKSVGQPKDDTFRNVQSIFKEWI